MMQVIPISRSLSEHSFAITIFPSQKADQKSEQVTNLRTFERRIRSIHAASKDRLPWFKCATFGEHRSDKNCLRHDDNVVSVTGVECDYDDEKIAPEEAASRLKEARIAAVVYTTASHTPEKPRWRAFAPFAAPMHGQRLKERRAAIAARLNGIFEGTLDGNASFNLSQAFYAGNVDGRPDIQTFLIEGARFIDKADDLDAQALDKRTKRVSPGKRDGNDAKTERARDASRSGHAQRFLVSCAREGMSEEQAREAIAEDVGAAGEWYRHAPNMGHQFPNSWRRARAYVEAQLTVQIEGILERLGVDPDDEQIEQLAGTPIEVSENGAALLFAALFGDAYRYDHTRGCWFRWTGHLWALDDRESGRDKLREICRALALSDEEKPARALLKANAVNGAERLARSLPHLACVSSDWDRSIWLLGTPDGAVDLSTGELRDGRPEDMITRSTTVAPIKRRNFDPKRDCPNWLAFLYEVTGGDLAFIRFMQQWFGYTLTGSTREHAFVFVHGPGGTGKSTIINIIGDLLGDYCVNVESETLTESPFERHTTELARLNGARMARASEVKFGRSWDQKRITAMTGGDKMTARFMRQNNFEYLPQFKLTVVGNSRPSVGQMDSAMERRLIVLPFEHKPSEPDKDLPERLKTEGPGILAWLIEGCLDWQKNGLVRPPIVVDYTTEYTSEQDVFARWAADCCEVGLELSDTTDNLWQSWEAYAFANGSDPGKRRGEFGDRMREHGFRHDNHCGPNQSQRGYKGLRVREPDSEDLVLNGGTHP